MPDIFCCRALICFVVHNLMLCYYHRKSLVACKDNLDLLTMDLSASPLAHSNGIKLMAHSVHLCLIRELHRYSYTVLSISNIIHILALFVELMFLTVCLLSISCVVFRGEIMILHLPPLLGGSRKKKQS